MGSCGRICRRKSYYAPAQTTRKETSKPFEPVSSIPAPQAALKHGSACIAALSAASTSVSERSGPVNPSSRHRGVQVEWGKRAESLSWCFLLNLPLAHDIIQ